MLDARSASAAACSSVGAMSAMERWFTVKTVVRKKCLLNAFLREDLTT